jgi:hypothetical protein
MSDRQDSLFEVEGAADAAPELPPLKGTPAQRDWAADVRRGKVAETLKVLRDWEEYIRRLQGAGKTEAAAREAAALGKARERWEWIRIKNTCRWWLDRRLNTARELLAGAEPNPGNRYHSTAAAPE